MKKCCITIISYKESLVGDEERSVKQALNVFSGRDIFFVVPEGLNVSYYDSIGKNHKYIRVNKDWMKNYDAYNRMCMELDFYKIFNDYEYMLIYQTDCWVFQDKLDYFMNFGYDWYGAPWPMYGYAVGNGGLSLRKVSKMIELTTRFKYDGKFHEDGWFCLTHAKELNICPWDKAVNFSLETISIKLLNSIKTIPMGLHSKDLICLWDENGDKFIEFKKQNT